MRFKLNCDVEENYDFGDLLITEKDFNYFYYFSGESEDGIEGFYLIPFGPFYELNWEDLLFNKGERMVKVIKHENIVISEE